MTRRATRLVCWLLALWLLTASAAILPAADEEISYDVTLSVFTAGVDRAAQTAVVTVWVRNTGPRALQGTLYGVLTDKTGTPLACGQTPVAATGRTLVTLTLPCRLPAQTDAALRLYFWNAGLHPLSRPVKQTLTLRPISDPPALNAQTATLILTRQDTVTLTASPAAVFESGDPAVAAVSAAGLVTPLAPGKTDLYAVNADRTAYAVCHVTVISDVTRLTLNAKTVSLNTADPTTYQLQATVTPADAPDRTVTYTSSDPAVATVSKTGLITAKAAGTATVTAQTGDGAARAQCAVTVTKSPTSLQLNQTALVMWDYGTYYLTATVKGGSGKTNVIWQSSDDTVATVSNSGIVYAVAKGTATITAKADGVTAACKVQVYREYDYMGSLAARFESGDDPGIISGSGAGKSYGCFQLYAGSASPRSFYNFLIDTGFHAEYGTLLKQAHQKDGGDPYVYGKAFDAAWKKLATEDREEFRSCQMAHGMSIFYEPLVNRLVSELNFYPDNYGLALKSALWSRSIQHGVGGAFNRVKEAFDKLGGFQGKTEKQLITAIYNESGAVVSDPPSAHAIAMNGNSSIAAENGLVGKYMKFFSANSSSVQAGVWYRLHVTELNLLYDMIKNPPVVITP